MKAIKSLLLFGICVILVSSCFDPPEYPNTPQIVLEDIYFREVGTNSVPDSLVIEISFKDGDGDLGLGTNDLDSPFHEQDFFLDATKKIATVRSSKLEGNEDLPGFVHPYNCLNYLYDTLFIPETQKDLFDDTYNIIDTFPANGLTYYMLLDTFYVERNPNHYNITVQFLEQDATGEFVEFDWRTIFPFPQCGETFDGRFPLLKRTDRNNVLEGNLKYAMKSTGFYNLFGSRPLKLRIQIKDRALNLSNVEETQPFTLDKIRR